MRTHQYVNAKATTRTARVPAKIPPISLPLIPGVDEFFDGAYDTVGVGVLDVVGATVGVDGVNTSESNPAHNPAPEGFDCAYSR